MNSNGFIIFQAERERRVFQLSDPQVLQAWMDIQEKRDCQVCQVNMEIQDCKAPKDCLEKRATRECPVLLVILWHNINIKMILN